MSAKNVNVSMCKFYSNKGKSGCLKLYNKFDDDDDKRIKELEFDESKQNSISISNCDFADEKASTMIYFVDGKISNELKINDCEFKGKLEYGKHYIEGKLLKNEKPKLHIKSCKFDDDKNSVNFELINEIEVNAISSNWLDFKEKNVSILFLYFVIFAILVLTALLYTKRLHSNNEDKEEIFNNVEL